MSNGKIAEVLFVENWKRKKRGRNHSVGGVREGEDQKVRSGRAGDNREIQRFDLKIFSTFENTSLYLKAFFSFFPLLYHYEIRKEKKDVLNPWFRQIRRTFCSHTITP